MTERDELVGAFHGLDGRDNGGIENGALVRSVAARRERVRHGPGQRHDGFGGGLSRGSVFVTDIDHARSLIGIEMRETAARAFFLGMSNSHVHLTVFISPYSAAYVEHLYLVLGSRPQFGSLLTVPIPTMLPNPA